MKRIFVSSLTVITVLSLVYGCGPSPKPCGVHEEGNHDIRLPMAMTIAGFGYDDGTPYCFYAYTLNEKLYRVLWTDFDGLNEQDMVLVDHNDIITELNDIQYPHGTWRPQYEVTAILVTPYKTVSEKEGTYFITLPNSGQSLTLKDEEKRFIPYITDELVKAAEEKITKKLTKYDTHSGLYLQVTEDYLCLTAEVIKYSGKYHEHIFYSERISSYAVPEESKTENVALEKSSVIYYSNLNETSALSALLWASYDNGDGTFTEADGFGIREALPKEDELTQLNVPELHTYHNSLVNPRVPVNGQVTNVYLLDMSDRRNYPMTETSWEEIEKLSPGRYYIVTRVLFSGNCDPDAPQHNLCYEDLFCLVINES